MPDRGEVYPNLVISPGEWKRGDERVRFEAANNAEAGRRGPRVARLGRRAHEDASPAGQPADRCIDDPFVICDPPLDNRQVFFRESSLLKADRKPPVREMLFRDDEYAARQA